MHVQACVVCYPQFFTFLYYWLIMQPLGYDHEENRTRRHTPFTYFPKMSKPKMRGGEKWILEWANGKDHRSEKNIYEKNVYITIVNQLIPLL